MAIAVLQSDKTSHGSHLCERCFLVSALIIFSLTGVSKIWAGFGSARVLTTVDPIFGITFGQLMLAAGVAEVVVAILCYSSKRQVLSLGLVAWMSTNFVVYRLGLLWMDWHRPCSCLGSLTEALHIHPDAADNLMKILLMYLIIGSYSLLISRLCKPKSN